EGWRSREGGVEVVEDGGGREGNLAVQTRIIAGARGLVATYGGFSYLGPLLGVPTLTFEEIEQTVPLHLEVIRRAMPDADYATARTGDDDAVATFVALLAAREAAKRPGDA